MRNPRNIIIIALCMAILYLPLLLLAVTGESKQTLDGEKDYALPTFKFRSFLDGSFQADFENWFSAKFPLRINMVEAYGSIVGKADGINFSFVSESNSQSEISRINTEKARFPEYVLQGEKVQEPAKYKGNDQVIIGANGYLYENGYINEYLGFSKKYADVGDAELVSRAAALKAIQDALVPRGIAFCVVITPSKASSLPQFIPDWYTAKYNEPPDYSRPYTRFVKALEDEGVFFVDSASVYQEAGLTNTFPKTSTHWSKLAAFETTSAIIAEYERQTGSITKRLAADAILQGTDPPGFGSSETDIFGIVYAGRKTERESAITDNLYYWPNAYVPNKDAPSIPHMLIQGGSFTDDIIYYFTEYEIAADIRKIRYNNAPENGIDWANELNTSFVLLEVNEQFVYNMGGGAPSWGQKDFLVSDKGFNIIDSLYEYLVQR